MDFRDFIIWEQSSRDTVDFKMAYVDMTEYTEADVARLGGDRRASEERGDLVSGLLLSQIVYWNLPSSAGKTKLRVEIGGRLWLAKTHGDWWDEIRITEEQAKRAVKRLSDLGIIDVEYHRFNGLRTTHIALNDEGFMLRWERAITTDRNVGNPPTETGITHRPLTETTSKTTTRRVRATKKSPPPAAQDSSKPKPEKEPTAHQAMIAAICEVTGYDLSIPSIKGQIMRTSKELRTPGLTAEDVRTVFGKGGWWWTSHWKGSGKGEMPSIRDLVMEIKKGLDATKPQLELVKEKYVNPYTGEVEYHMVGKAVGT